MSSIEGMDEVLDMLDGLEDEIMEAALKGLEQGLKLVVGQAKALCPVDSGRLKGSITSKAERKGNKIEAEVGPHTDYAVYVEMGTGRSGEASHNGVSPVAASRVTYHPTHNGMPARPFLYPAYKMTKSRIVAAVKRAIDNRR